MQLFDEGEIDVVLCKGQESELKKLSVDEEQYRRLVREHRFYSFTKSQVFGLKHLKYGQADFGKEAL